FEIGGVNLAAEAGGVFGEVERGTDVGLDGDDDLVFFGKHGPGFQAVQELRAELGPLFRLASDDGFDERAADVGGEFAGGFELADVGGGVAGETEILHDGDDGELVIGGESAGFGGV